MTIGWNDGDGRVGGQRADRALVEKQYDGKEIGCLQGGDGEGDEVIKRGAAAEDNEREEPGY